MGQWTALEDMELHLEGPWQHWRALLWQQLLLLLLHRPVRQKMVSRTLTKEQQRLQQLGRLQLQQRQL